MTKKKNKMMTHRARHWLRGLDGCINVRPCQSFRLFTIQRILIPIEKMRSDLGFRWDCKKKKKKKNVKQNKIVEKARKIGNPISFVWKRKMNSWSERGRKKERERECDNNVWTFARETEKNNKRVLYCLKIEWWTPLHYRVYRH